MSRVNEYSGKNKNSNGIKLNSNAPFILLTSAFFLKIYRFPEIGQNAFHIQICPHIST